MPADGLGNIGINLELMEPALAKFQAALGRLEAANATIATNGDLLMKALEGGAQIAFSTVYIRWQKNQASLQTDLDTMNANTKGVVGAFVENDVSTAAVFSRM